MTSQLELEIRFELKDDPMSFFIDSNFYQLLK